MRPTFEILGLVIAMAAVVATMLSAIRAVVLPRATQNFLPRVTTRAVRSAFRLRAHRLSSYPERDRVMAMLAPVALLSMLLTWVLVIFASYAVMFFCLGGRSVAAAVEMSGSSIVTLGTTADPRFWPSALSYSEAGLGLLLVALFISYFPSIYSAFTRRETGVTLLQVRAGDPPRATTMLIRYQRIEESHYRLTELWRSWETWFADIEESHTTFPILAYFRSPQPERSWVTSAGALLDAASFWMAAIDHPNDPDAQLCVRAGFLALRRIADAFDISYDPDPGADGPISVSRAEWDDAVAELAEAGVPLLADRDRAWADWRGWRVNYDSVLLRLARLTEAPPAPWVSDRSPIAGPAPHAPGRRANGWRPGPRRWPRTRG
jgi:ABC-type multidrug transport system fused ATPase/permease subunit